MLAAKGSMDDIRPISGHFKAVNMTVTKHLLQVYICGVLILNAADSQSVKVTVTALYISVPIMSNRAFKT